MTINLLILAFNCLLDEYLNLAKCFKNSKRGNKVIKLNVTHGQELTRSLVHN